jgi:hypothetical protein
MRTLICSMGASLDGLIAGPEGEIDYSAPENGTKPHQCCFHERAAFRPAPAADLQTSPSAGRGGQGEVGH